MQESLYVAFLSLVQFDQETNALRARVLALQKELEVLKQQEVALREMQEVASKQLHEARKEVDDYELEMRALEEARLTKNRLFEQASSTREHQALRKEIDVLLHRQNELEQKLMLFWNLVDTRRKALQECTDRVERERTVLQSALQAQEAHIVEVRQQITVREQEWQSYTVGLPEDLLQKYNMMRTAIADPVIPIENGACTVCCYALTQNDKALLRHSHLMQCTGCFRLLYMSKPTESI
jgi:predicted  nucleic acid-binding Zn-ribbon protein